MDLHFVSLVWKSDEIVKFLHYFDLLCHCEVSLLSKSFVFLVFASAVLRYLGKKHVYCLLVIWYFWPRIRNSHVLTTEPQNLRFVLDFKVHLKIYFWFQFIFIRVLYKLELNIAQSPKETGPYFLKICFVPLNRKVKASERTKFRNINHWFLFYIVFQNNQCQISNCKIILLIYCMLFKINKNIRRDILINLVQNVKFGEEKFWGH